MGRREYKKSIAWRHEVYEDEGLVPARTRTLSFSPASRRVRRSSVSMASSSPISWLKSLQAFHWHMKYLRTVHIRQLGHVQLCTRVGVNEIMNGAQPVEPDR